MRYSADSSQLPGDSRSDPRRILGTAALLALLLAPAAPAQTARRDSIQPQAWRQIGALLSEKAGRTEAQRNIASDLLMEIKQRRRDPSLAGLPELPSGVAVSETGTVLVDVTSEVSEELLARIEELGGRVVNHHVRWDSVRAELPLIRVEALAEWPGLRSIRPADAYMTQAVVSEGDVAHGADVARAASGADGGGLKVCAMSDSVDELAALIAAGELPAGTTFLPGQSGNPGTSEGTALMEIIHDLAPGAELLFATGAGGQAQFAQNILDLRAAGCEVIVDDIIYFAEGVFQDDIVAQAVEEVAADGAIFVSAAGNSGNENDGTSGVYEGDYSGTALPAPLAGAGLSAHDFSGGGQNFNVITEVAPNDAPFFTLQWADPLGASGNDYDLFLLDPTGTTIIDFSTTVQNGNDDPFEIINSQGQDHSARKLVVVKFSGADRFIHLNTHRGRLSVSTNGQIFGHPAAANAIAVAAVDVADAGGAGGVFDGTESVEAFSSDGPRRIFFEAGGSPVSVAPVTGSPGPRGVPASVVRQKPDVAAADGVSVASSNFEPTFFGTSAAAPHIAALAALLIDEMDALMTTYLGGEGLPLIHSVAQLRGVFGSSALDIEASGFDPDSGFGLPDITRSLTGPGDPNLIFADGFESGDVSAWTD